MSKNYRNTAQWKEVFCSMRETMPEYILRIWPETEAELNRLLHNYTTTHWDMVELEEAIAHANHRSIQLLRGHAMPAHIHRTREELGKLELAKQLLNARGIA